MGQYWIFSGGFTIAPRGKSHPGQRANEWEMTIGASRPGVSKTWGATLEMPAEELCERTAEQAGRFPPGKYEWPALMRLVEKKAPDFSD